MRAERWDPADTATLQACFEACQAAWQADAPGGPPLSLRLFSSQLTCGWSGNPREVWFAPGEGGAYYVLTLPDRENLARAQLDLIVHPARRRHGLGRALLGHAMTRAAAHGRSVLSGTAARGSPGEAFARAAGAAAGLVDICRVLDLRGIPEGRLGPLRSEAEKAAAGYSLMSWTGPVPDEFLDEVAAVFAALNDAPHGPGVERTAWDAQRIREGINVLITRSGSREYSVAARHDATGEMAALTQVAVDPAGPDWGHQLMTGVTRAHRGHRLGLLTKVAMLEWLATAEPRLERIETWNAEANRHMIAVNEALGYEIHGQPFVWWQLEIPAAEVTRGSR